MPASEIKKQYRKLQRAGRLHWFHWLVVVTSLLLTLGAWYFSTQQVEQKVQLQFDREAERVVDMIVERMQKYEDTLWSGASAMHTVDGNFSRSEWRIFAQALQIEKRHPGINGIGVIYYLQPGNVPQYLAEQRVGRPAYDIHPAHHHADLWPITYIEPEDLNAAAIGLDIAHESNRYAAALKARDTGRSAITGPIVLVQDAGKTPGFLFYAPFYSRPSRTVTERRENFLGLVYAPFVMKKLMDGILDQGKRSVDIRIVDQGQTLYDEHNPSQPHFDPEPLYQKSAHINLFGRSWMIELFSVRSFREENQFAQPMLILLGGIVIDILLLTLFVLLSRSNRRALRFAETMSDFAEKQRATAVQRSKMAALGEMAAGIAHEINNPLAILHGYVVKIGVLRDQDALTDSIWADHKHKLLSTMKRITDIIKGLRSFSRDGAHDRMREERVSDVIEESLSLCRERFHNHGVNLVVGVESDAVISCRRVQISQVLINLLNNARQAVEVLPEGQRKWVRLSVEVEGERVRIEVSDSGGGIPAHVRERLFEPFFTTKDVGEGTGLGLSISQGIVEDHQGHLYLDTTQAATTFVIDLPGKAVKSETAEPPSLPSVA